MSSPKGDFHKAEFRGYVPHYKDQSHRLGGSDKKKTVPFNYDDRKNYEDLVERGFIDPNDGLFTPDMFVYPKTWEEARKKGMRNFSRMPTGSSIFDKCVLCSKPPEKGMQHECGAVCCFKCWKSKVFEGPEDRKCPNPHCSARVKRKYLKPVNRCTASTSATSGHDGEV